MRVSIISLILSIYLISHIGSSLVLIDSSSNSKGRTSDESNDESIFEGK